MEVPLSGDGCPTDRLTNPSNLESQAGFSTLAGGLDLTSAADRHIAAARAEYEKLSWWYSLTSLTPLER